jgi:hypothetical protein
VNHTVWFNDLGAHFVEETMARATLSILSLFMNPFGNWNNGDKKTPPEPDPRPRNGGYSIRHTFASAPEHPLDKVPPKHELVHG